MLKYIYLTSSGYSGSTLLSFILGAHRKIATIGELSNVIKKYDPDNYKCSCLKLVRDCKFWQNITKKMEEKGYKFSYKYFGTSLIPKSNKFIDQMQFKKSRYWFISEVRNYVYQRIPSYRKHTYNIFKRNIDLANIVLSITGKDVFFDASKDPNRIYYLKKFLDCEFKVIHLIKDGRGVMDSIKRYDPKRTDYSAILSWKKHNKFTEKCLKNIKKQNQYSLLYRDLTEKTTHTLDKLCNFIGVNYDPQCLRFTESEHHIIGNRMRLKESNKIYHDEKWRKTLTRKQLILFEQLAGKLNKKYGYY